MKDSIISVVFFLVFFQTYAQTCCTANSTSHELINPQVLDNGDFRVQFLSDYNVIDNIVVNSISSRSKTLKRTVFSITSQAEYSFSSKWAVGVSLPFHWKKEETPFANFSIAGVGDVVTFLKRTDSLSQKIQFTIGVGVKLPTGEINNASDGFVLPPTLQNGTGSTDFVFLTAIGVTLFDNPNSLFNLLIRYRLNGKSDGIASHSSFSFGDEYEVAMSYQNQFSMLNRFLGFSVGVRSILASNNVINNLEDINSGGFWMASTVQVVYPISPKVGFSLGTHIPVFFRINGLQLVTRQRFNMGIAAII